MFKFYFSLLEHTQSDTIFITHDNTSFETSFLIPKASLAITQQWIQISFFFLSLINFPNSLSKLEPIGFWLFECLFIFSICLFFLCNSPAFPVGQSKLSSYPIYHSLKKRTDLAKKKTFLGWRVRGEAVNSQASFFFPIKNALHVLAAVKHCWWY